MCTHYKCSRTYIHTYQTIRNQSDKRLNDHFCLHYWNWSVHNMCVRTRRWTRYYWNALGNFIFRGIVVHSLNAKKMVFKCFINLIYCRFFIRFFIVVVETKMFLHLFVAPIHHKYEKKQITTEIADEHLAELMPIFERLRAQEQIPCVYPLHMGAGGTAFIRGGSSRSTPLSPHAPHCHPSTHWVSLICPQFCVCSTGQQLQMRAACHVAVLSITVVRLV